MRKPKEYVKPDNCKYCGYRMDCATKLGKHPRSRPSPGDISLCIKCGGLHTFDELLTIQRTPADFLDTVPRATHRLIIAAQSKIAFLNKRN